MAKKTIKELAKGEFFRLTDSETAPVWVRSDYDRSSKSIHATNFMTFVMKTFSRVQEWFLLTLNSKKPWKKIV